MMKRIDELTNMVKEKRLGFLIDEVMSGTHHFEDGCGPPGKHKMEFCVSWGPKDLLSWANPMSGEFMTQSMEGTVTIEGLCTEAPCKGTLELKYFTEHTIRYTFDFKVGKKDYHYVGEKVNIKPWNLLVSHTTCFGRLTEKGTGRLISTSITYFKLHLLPKFLASVRLA